MRNTNEILIKFKQEGDKMKLTWNLNPKMKLEDMYEVFSTAKDALSELVSRKVKEENITTEKQFLKWIKGKTIGDLEI